MSTLKRTSRAEHKATEKAVRARDSLPVRAAGALAELADQPPLIALSAGTMALGLIGRRPDLARGGARMLAAHLLATGVKTMLKQSIDRTRPAKAVADGHHVGRGRGSKDTDLNSFPSGHTAGAVAVAQAAARDLPAAALPGRIAALAVGAIQTPRGKHYVSDVIAGAVIGWASERLVSALFARVPRPAEPGSLSGPILPATPPVPPAAATG